MQAFVSSSMKQYGIIMGVLVSVALYSVCPLENMLGEMLEIILVETVDMRILKTLIFSGYCVLVSYLIVWCLDLRKVNLMLNYGVSLFRNVLSSLGRTLTSLVRSL